MEIKTLFEAVDAVPFRPFSIELISGRRIEVSHPENIVILPTRQKVRHIEVYHFDPWDMAMIYPEGVAALLFDGKEEAARGE